MAIRTTEKQTAVRPMDVTNGTVQFWNDELAAANQACADVANLNTVLASNSGNGGAPDGPEGAAAGFGAAAGVAGALFMAGNFGLGVANAIKSNTNAAQVQLTIANYSTSPIVVYDCNPTYLDISDMPDPLASGNSDVLVLTKPSFNTSANFTVLLQIGSGPNSSIPFQVEYAYDTSITDRWTISAAAGGSDVYAFSKNLQMYGLSFTGNTGYPSFSVYTSNIETGSGVLSMAVYNMASS